MTAHFHNAVISLFSKSSMCYIHYTPTPNLDSESPACDEAKSYRFEPEAGVICQPQCWQNWGEAKHQRNFDISGMDGLMTENNKWDVSGKNFLKSLCYHWKKTSYATDSESMIPAVEGLVSGQNGNPSTGAAVPVCFLPQSLKDLAGKSRYIEGTLPCVCGNDLGNETTAFLDIANLKSWVGVEDDVGLTEVGTKRFEMDRVNPIDTYIVQYNLGTSPIMETTLLAFPRISIIAGATEAMSSANHS